MREAEIKLKMCSFAQDKTGPQPPAHLVQVVVGDLCPDVVENVRHELLLRVRQGVKSLECQVKLDHLHCLSSTVCEHCGHTVCAQYCV